ncbi:MAG: DMT family transporter [Chitinophagaceae bacterium]|nr:DMT family transporter [Chitinophagaceae bacterium]
MSIDNRFKGIVYMLLAALGFSVMGGAAKIMKGSFGAGQLVFWRNAIGLLLLLVSFKIKPAVSRGGKPGLLIFRGLMGTLALYALLYCILHIPLGTAMTYNLSSALFIAIFSFLLFKEYHGRIVLFAVLLGFFGLLLVYKPSLEIPWYYHLAGLITGICSALAYMSVNRLAPYYDRRIIMLAFILCGSIVPVLFMIVQSVFHFSPDPVFMIGWQWPQGDEWLYIGWLGLSAYFGQYFVTMAYASDKAGIVSAINYVSILFAVAIGVALGDAWPDLISATGMFCIIACGIIISVVKWRSRTPTG